MHPTTAVAIIAATVSVLGWVVNYLLTSYAERRKAHLSARLSHIEMQLSELYGPLVFLIHEGRATFEDLLRSLGRNYVFIRNEPLPDDELQVWLFWVDFYFMPRNNKIQSILSTKVHLIEGDKLPESYVRFLYHYNSWRVTHERWKRHGIRYQWHSNVNWPDDFANDVVDTFQQLMKRHAELIGAIR